MTTNTIQTQGPNLPNDQAERLAVNAGNPETKMTEPTQVAEPQAGSQFAPATLLGDSVAYLKKGYKLKLLVESEDAAKRLYNSMSPEFQERFVCAWGQVAQGEVSGVWPDDKDWKQKIPHLYLHSRKEDGTIVYHQL